MTRHNRRNGLLSARSCYGLVVYVADLLWTCYEEFANLLRTCYFEAGVMDFSLNPAHWSNIMVLGLSQTISDVKYVCL